MSPGRLEGLRVLVTRPGHQSGPLCAMLESEGATPVQFPVLAIEPVEESESLIHTLDSLPDQQLVVFTSPNAVHACMELMQRQGRSWPEGPEVAAIGRATADTLQGVGVPVAICPEGPYTSEGLLAHPRLHQVSGQRILLIRGEGGRQLLADTLRERGAQVQLLEVYRRIRPEADASPLIRRLREGGLDVAVVTSLEGLDNLIALVGSEERDALFAAGLVTVSGRVATAARVRGFQGGIVVAPEASDSGLIEGLVRWRAQRENTGAIMSDDETTRKSAQEQAQTTDKPDSAAPTGEAQAPPSAAGEGASGDDRPPAPVSPAGERAQRLAGVTLLLLVILALAAAAGAWWIYERMQHLESVQRDLVSQQQYQELRESAVAQAERLAGRVDNLAAEHQAHQQTLAETREAMQQLRDSQNRVGERMTRLEELAAAHRDDWIHSEVDYLYSLARQRLELRADPNGALAALRIADELLAELGGSGLEARQELRGFINALLDVRSIDAGDIDGRLQALTAGVEIWPLQDRAPRLEPEPLGRQPEADLTTFAGWRQASSRAWDQFRSSLSSLVVVRREDAPVELMAPDEEWFLRENLRLELQTARLALIQQEPAVYRHSLERTGDWLQRHFNIEDGRVRQALAEIETLAGKEIRPALPSLPSDWTSGGEG
ncbi:MAG: uroporphyrinogen-III C-methyltransferase [Ectothiorhodospiraceae bacterium]|nr:uroporphyrinogen-III C-methyltransferase [Ectothiorhodospiraceae bacterium]